MSHQTLVLIFFNSWPFLDPAFCVACLFSEKTFVPLGSLEPDRNESQPGSGPACHPLTLDTQCVCASGRHTESSVPSHAWSRAALTRRQR